MVYTLRFFFSSKCSLFNNSNVFGSCVIHILYKGCAKIKKNNYGAKRLNVLAILQWGDRDSTVVLCYKSEGRWFDPSWLVSVDFSFA